MSYFSRFLSPNDSKPNQVLKFWFSGIESPEKTSGNLTPYWFNATDELNLVIRENFSQDIEKAISGLYDDWMQAPLSSLSLVILSDQFTRNLYSNSSDRVKGDVKARQVSLNIISQGFESQLWPIHLAFVYLPFEHSESLDDQHLSVRKHEELVSKVPDSLRPSLKPYLNYATIHKNVIERFGRFPGRNQILNRESTNEELKYLAEDPFKF